MSNSHGEAAGTASPRIALIGCGAIAENFHLPALARHPALLPNLVLCDPSRDRAAALGEHFGVGQIESSYADVLDRVDGVIVAVPHHLHEPITLECLQAGVHVLCEKPLAETATGVQRLVEAAEAAGVALMVNQTRRLFPSHRRVKQMLEAGQLGRLTRITYTMGEPFEWPAATGSYFGASGARKGVLLDTGAHIIDLVTWWLDGPDAPAEAPRLADYRDDSLGGTEAVAQVEIEAGGCRASVRLSWLSKLANRFVVEGEEGRIEGGAYDWGIIEHTDARGQVHRIKTSDRHESFEDFAGRLIDNFVDVLRGSAEPLVGGREVLASVGIIDACYEARKRFAMPWLEAAAPRAAEGVRAS